MFEKTKQHPCQLRPVEWVKPSLSEDSSASVTVSKCVWLWSSSCSTNVQAVPSQLGYWVMSRSRVKPALRVRKWSRAADEWGAPNGDDATAWVRSIVCDG